MAGMRTLTGLTVLPGSITCLLFTLPLPWQRRFALIRPSFSSTTSTPPRSPAFCHGKNALAQGSSCRAGFPFGSQGTAFASLSRETENQRLFAESPRLPALKAQGILLLPLPEGQTLSGRVPKAPSPKSPRHPVPPKPRRPNAPWQSSKGSQSRKPNASCSSRSPKARRFLAVCQRLLSRRPDEGCSQDPGSFPLKEHRASLAFAARPSRAWHVWAFRSSRSLESRPVGAFEARPAFFRKPLFG